MMKLNIGPDMQPQSPRIGEGPVCLSDLYMDERVVMPAVFRCIYNHDVFESFESASYHIVTCDRRARSSPRHGEIASARTRHETRLLAARQKFTERPTQRLWVPTKQRSPTPKPGWESSPSVHPPRINLGHWPAGLKITRGNVRISSRPIDNSTNA